MRDFALLQMAWNNPDHTAARLQRMIGDNAHQPGTAAAWHLGQSDVALLKKMVEDHHSWTGSLRAREILDSWAESRAKFVKVFPNEYRRALAERSAAKAATAAVTQAKGQTAAAK